MFDEQQNESWAKGLQHAADVLIRRGTAMGPLVPLLLLVPIFLLSAYFFRDVIAISVVFSFVAVGIVVEYCRQYSHFSKNEPDRLQSEEYRYGMKQMQMISGKELPYPMPANKLNLTKATSNPIYPLPNLKDIDLKRDATCEETK